MMPEVKEALNRLDTLPKLLLDHAENRPDHSAIREKAYGIWQTWTWGNYADHARSFACGLASHGVSRGDKVAIVGDNRPELYAAMAAAQCLGAIPVPLYQDAVADEMQYVLDHAEATVVVLEDQEQVDKVLSVREKCPKLELLIYKDPRGLRYYRQHDLFRFSEVQARGEQFDADNPDFFLTEVSKGRGEDMSVILYTSGTTGQPKGVMTLTCEVDGQTTDLDSAISESLQSVCKVRGTIALVEPGSLPNDGKIIDDTRTYE